MEKVILYNAIRTPDGTVLESKHGHDYVSHTDKNGKTYAVDGGHNYLRRIGDIEDCQDLTIYDDGNHILRRKCLRWGVNYDKYMNRLPQTEWRLIKHLTTEHIEAILSEGHADKNPFYKKVFEDELNLRKEDKKEDIRDNG